MAGSIFPDIDPDITSGVDLANLLNDFKDLVASGASTNGGSRPTNLQPGGLWVDQQNDPVWDLKQYDGTSDYTLITLNRTTGAVTLGALGDSLKLTRDSDDSVGSKFTLFKKRTSGDEAIDDLDTIGTIDFSGNSDTPTEQITAQIEVLAEDDFTDAIHGSSMRFYTTSEGANALVERLRLHKDGAVGINNSSPQKLLDVLGGALLKDIKNSQVSDTADGATLFTKKARIAGSGQVLLGDVIGRHDFISTDDGGNEVTVARIEVKATENHTSGAHGVEVVFYAVSDGGSTLVEILKFTNGQTEGDDFKQKLTLEDDQATRNLADIDGATYGSVEIIVNARGRDTGSDERFQVTRFNAVYDEVNTQWELTQKDEVISDGDPLLDFTITNGSTLNIDYVNQIAFGVFQDGFIYLDVRRVKR